MRGLFGGATGASISGCLGGMIPGSEQAASVKETTTDAALMLPIIMAHKPNSVHTSTKKKYVGVQINAYVTSMHGQSGPVKNVRGAIL